MGNIDRECRGHFTNMSTEEDLRQEKEVKEARRYVNVIKSTPGLYDLFSQLHFIVSVIYSFSFIE